jgi:hypothetical protein
MKFREDGTLGLWDSDTHQLLRFHNGDVPIHTKVEIEEERGKRDITEWHSPMRKFMAGEPEFVEVTLKFKIPKSQVTIYRE